MSEGQSAPGRTDEVLLAVERVAADVAALSRALAAQPEAVAARVDLDAATASIGVRVGALGSALDQFRLSLLAALDRTAERLDRPAPEVKAALADLSTRIDAPEWVPLLQVALENLAAHLDTPVWLPGLQRELAANTAAVAGIVAELADQDGRFEGVVDVLSGVARRQDQLTDAVTALDHERGRHALDVPTGASPNADVETVRALEALTEMFEQHERELAFRLDQIDAELGRVRNASRSAAVGDQQPGDLALQLGALAARQDELLAAISASVDGVRGPMATAAVFDRMEQRERSLAARLDRIDLQLRQGGRPVPGSLTPAGGLDTGAVDAVATSVDAIAAVTEDLHALVQATAERLEQRLAGVEAALDQATSRASKPSPPLPSPSPATEGAALRLAHLRAERAQVQARLQEERLLAAQTAELWEDE